jgi:adenosine deaminase
VHAGESSGPEGVRDALDLLGADRIDHGVRAIDDPALVAELAERRIPLGVCPSSNLTLGIYPSLDQHPLDALLRAGVAVSVNTDDPGFLGIDLVSEYERCVAAFGWDDDTVAEVARTSLAACFSLGRIA